jgi:hypothetical protein
LTTAEGGVILRPQAVIAAPAMDELAGSVKDNGVV